MDEEHRASDSPAHLASIVAELAQLREQLQQAREEVLAQRKLAEASLLESRARLDYAVRLSGVGFWYCDLPFDELTWDERVKQHFAGSTVRLSFSPLKTTALGSRRHPCVMYSKCSRKLTGSWAGLRVGWG